jgi:hypothetical protein
MQIASSPNIGLNAIRDSVKQNNKHLGVLFKLAIIRLSFFGRMRDV